MLLFQKEINLIKYLAIFGNERNSVFCCSSTTYTLLSFWARTGTSCALDCGLTQHGTIDSVQCCYRPQRIWGKVIFSQASVILSTRGAAIPACIAGGIPACLVGEVLSQLALQVVSQHALQGVCGIPACIAGGIPACLAGGCLLLGGLLWGEVCSWGGAWSWGWGVWWRPPSDGYCCGRYASYWNAFLLSIKFK